MITASRYERKFVTTHFTPAELRWMVLMHPAHFRELYPPRHVNNIYFDTPGLSDYASHVNGAGKRWKFRVRWYGDLHRGEPAAALEVKTKSGTASSKVTYPLQALDASAPFEEETLRSLIENAPIADWVKSRLRYRLPTLLNRYRRSYYQSCDGRFRITVDNDLSFSSIAGAPFAGGIELSDAELTIVELKYELRLDSIAERISSRFPFHLDKLSKYVYGIQRLRQPRHDGRTSWIPRQPRFRS